MRHNGAVTVPFAWRPHQRQALAALDAARAAGRSRAWVVLPPGAGKTAVGIEHVRRVGRRAVAFGPNTAIQAQWAAAWEQVDAHPASTDRTIAAPFTALTYQALATFDPDADDDASHVERLHPHGQSLVAALADAGPLTLVLDECHHLLEVWGALLAEVLDRLPDVQVLALTATPPGRLTAKEAALVAELFGDIVYAAPLPALVASGELAPFVELAWFTAPTPAEADWLAARAERFAELVAGLTSPDFGSTGLLTWLDLRVAPPEGPGLDWTELVRADPGFADAIVRLHWAGHVQLPDGAVVREAHRREPSVEDWMAVVDEWLRHGIGASEDPADVDARAQVRAALPSVGYVWTRHGVRRGPSLVDRVLARSASKAAGAVEVVRAALAEPGARILVLTDHIAAATVPRALTDVLEPEAASAFGVLRALLADAATATAHPLLVTGELIGGEPATLECLAAAHAGPEATRPGLADVPGEGWSQLVGWSPAAWVPAATRFFESDDPDAPRVLVGTRALLGEGWDARRVTGVVDLTSATTSTAVVQTRGRALRLDPTTPDKVAVNWTITCVFGRNPQGGSDYARCVAKHAGWFGVDDSGAVIEGIAHCDATLSPHRAPADADLDALNVRALVRAQRLDAVREAWAAVDPDVAGPSATLVVRDAPRGAFSAAPNAALVAWRSGVGAVTARPGSAWGAWLAATAAVLAVLAAGALGQPALLLVPGIVVAVLAAVVGRRGVRALADARRPPSLFRLGAAVADGLHAAGLSRWDARAVEVHADADGALRCRLAGADAAASAAFVDALEEVLAPLDQPRYVVPRGLVRTRASVAQVTTAGLGWVRYDAEVWHAVPSALTATRAAADGYARAWARWVGGGPAVFVGSPEGAGILAAQRGSDPFALGSGTQVVRRVRW